MTVGGVPAKENRKRFPLLFQSNAIAYSDMRRMGKKRGLISLAGRALSYNLQRR